MVKVVFVLEDNSGETYKGKYVMVVRANIGKYSQEVISFGYVEGGIHKELKNGDLIFYGKSY